MGASHGTRFGCGDPRCDGCRLMRGVYDAEDQRTESPARIRRRDLMIERRARQRAQFVDAEPCRAILMEAARAVGRRPEVVGEAVGLSAQVVRSMVHRDFPHVAAATADAVRRLLPLLPSELETA